MEVKLDFKDVLIVPRSSNITSRSTVSLVRELTCPHGGRVIKGVPIIASNMDTVGTFEMASTLESFEMFTAVHKFVCPEGFDDYALHGHPINGDHGGAFFSLGLREADFDGLTRIKSTQLLCLDSPNGYTQAFVDLVKRVREHCPDAFILAGSVVTPVMSETLIQAGASCVRVGIGSGSACTTRIKTGVGYPQLSAVMECAPAAHCLGGYICSDGGCTVPGDVAKAFCAGADMVMLGGMLAGTTETGGTLCDAQGRPWGGMGQSYINFRGMASQEAMLENYGQIESYRAAEGKSVLIPYRGSVVPIVQDLLGGLRGCCSFIGATEIAQMSQLGAFVRVTGQENTVFNSL